MDDSTKRQIPGTIIPESFNRVDRLEKYVHLGSTRPFCKGSVVLSQGSETNNVMYVQSGCLAVSMGADDGHNKFLFQIGEQSIGMTTFLSENHELQIVAVKDSVVCFFTIEEVLKICHEDEQLIVDIIQNLSSKVYYFMTQSRDLNFSRPASRVFRFLYNLCLHDGKQIEDYYIIHSNLTQKAIGEITGTHYVTVSKLLTILEKQKVLRKTKDAIYVYNLEKLKNMINEVFEY
ncbi:Crp/Fnr family transcriptional regulator [Dehalobacter sp. 14DCB1]|jgi:CRP/FNR family transcriptional regulator|uniref:Crp/Fnr family transcriptional regulator n=1 Tax=Dehalobacter sp. 14DCB1 TaxID=2070227 RepID=UPI001047C757|nr:Crp/Fnr family transcriptional regulator [Dehalobacter sp. 14DCB1]TCX53469.1 Crp/Fnr family transcriptional regulator [Dehalobacter sp. 14DCB1]